MLLSVSRHKCPVLCSCRHIRIYLPCPLGPPHLYPSPPHQTSPCVTPCIWRCRSDDLLPLSWKLPKIEQTASYCYVIESLILPNWVESISIGCCLLGHVKNQIYRFLYPQLRFNNLFGQEFFVFFKIFALLFNVVILNGGFWDKLPDLFLVFKAYRPRYTDYLCKWIPNHTPTILLTIETVINKNPIFLII